MTWLRERFPGLGDSYEVTSEPTPGYNCVGWAVEPENKRWWWPDEMGVDYWPAGAIREVSLRAFEDAFGLLGYRRCRSSSLEQGIEKVVVFTDSTGEPTHTARQLPNGQWTSKLGPHLDMTHELVGLTGPDYGEPAIILSRPHDGHL